jgi:NitT/TauT family transport system ATP-binding protein
MTDRTDRSEAKSGAAPRAGAPATPPVLEYRGVGKIFPALGSRGIFRALETFDLSISQGEFVALVGPSGCGKSTLLMITGALLEASEGTVLLDGQPMTGTSRKIGIMFQAPVLFPWRTIENNVLLPADIYKIPKATVRDDVQRVIDLVGLSEFAQAYPKQLSGGMQQRAALARVLAYKPEVLLMDEPFGALDEFTREAMNIELMRLTEEAGITVLFVTHNIPEAVFLADRVVVMATRPGRVAGIVNVPFARPRTINLMQDPEYTELTFRVRRMLGGAVGGSEE